MQVKRIGQTLRHRLLPIALQRLSERGRFHIAGQTGNDGATHIAGLEQVELMRQGARRLHDHNVRLAGFDILEAIGLRRIVVVEVADLRGVTQCQSDGRSRRDV